MASKSMFEGKNAVQQSAHIRSVKYKDGNQGFSSNKLGGDTTPANTGPGAPLRSAAKPSTSTTRQAGLTGGNPFNEHVGDEGNILGPQVAGQNAGRYPDSPVPSSAQTPDINIRSKAGQVAASAARSGDSPPSDGVLGRG